LRAFFYLEKIIMPDQRALKDPNNKSALIIQDSTGTETRQVRSTVANPNAVPVEVVASVSPGVSGSASVTSVNDTVTSTTLIDANSSAEERIIQNDSASTLYVKFGTTASATNYTVKLYTDDVLTTSYIGRIDGIWSADSTGAAKITELS
jgi:hypothetical protein